MFEHILRHGATAVAASAISVSLIAGMALAGVSPLAGASPDRSPEERSTACFAITDPAELDARIAELQADLDARLDAAVAAGVLTEETAAEISERVTTFLERCRDAANEPDRPSDAKERSKEHSRDRGLGEIFRLVAGREIGSFFRACFDPTFADREAQLAAALTTLTSAIDAAVSVGDITPERGTELRDRLAALVERCGTKDGMHEHRDGDRQWFHRRGDAEKTTLLATPPTEVRSFEQFFRPASPTSPTSTAKPSSGSTTTWGGWGSTSGSRSWSGGR